jgi:hypothetical protein
MIKTPWLISLMASTMMVTSIYASKKDPEYLHAMRSGALTRIIVSTTDDDGNPVSDVAINVLMGMDYREEAYFINGKTDKQGKFVVEGITKGNEIEIEATKDGHYDAFKKLCFIRRGEEYNVKNGRWQPWGMEVSLPLREKRNPITLVRMADFIDLLSTNKWFGFDMKEKDWIASGHKGKVADFEAMLIWDGRHISTSQQTDLHLRFVGEGAGYYFTEQTFDSAFKGIYNAQTNILLQKEFICKTSLINGVFTRIGLPKGKMLVARSRCKLDNKGRVIEANYSIFNGFIVGGKWGGKAGAFFGYDFNPTPNDTNLEPANMP